MPLAGPSYPKGPYRFINREYMIISYETDPEIIRAQLPEPLEPIDTPLVHYEWILHAGFLRLRQLYGIGPRHSLPL